MASRVLRRVMRVVSCRVAGNACGDGAPGDAMPLLTAPLAMPLARVLRVMPLRVMWWCDGCRWRCRW